MSLPAGLEQFRENEDGKEETEYVHSVSRAGFGVLGFLCGQPHTHHIKKTLCAVPSKKPWMPWMHNIFAYTDSL